MSKERGQSLALRLRNAIDSQNAARARAADEAESRRRWLSAERERLFKDLWSFGETIGHLSISGADEVLSFKLGDRELRFESKGSNGKVRISGTGIEKGTEAFVQTELELWVVSSPAGRGKVEQTVLFDQGLEQLMNTAFALTE